MRCLYEFFVFKIHTLRQNFVTTRILRSTTASTTASIAASIAAFACFALPPMTVHAQTAMAQHSPQMPQINQQPAEYLPFGDYPHIDGIVRKEQKIQSLQKEVDVLRSKMEQTVRTFATHRNMTCFGDPCLFQIFPLAFTKRRNQEFFGGLRAKITNITRRNPNLWSLDLYSVRSDTQQWVNRLSLDIPKIEWLPRQPRLKLRLNQVRSTETRYYGSGSSFIENKSLLNDHDLRYAINEVNFQSSLLVPLFKLQDQQIGIAAQFSSTKHRPSAFAEIENSKLFQDAPFGVSGGISSRAGAGLYIDSRDQETFSRTGWLLEFFFENAGPPLGEYSFKRLTLVDSRYASRGRFTLANRITIDSFIGKEVPFWELRSVGGIDPISDVSGSLILRGYSNGRFHERIKISNSSELRYQLDTRRIFGLLTDTVLMPAAIDVARLGMQNAVSFTTGTKFLFNKNLQVQTWLSFSDFTKDIYLEFGQAF